MSPYPLQARCAPFDQASFNARLYPIVSARPVLPPAYKRQGRKMSNNNHSDTVGYKQPPKGRQFQPGNSGNPSGRPKGVRNFKTDLREELSESISIREGGRDVSISKQRALIKRLVASAIDGDARSISTLMSFCARAFGDDDEGRQPEAPEDQEIMHAFGKRRAKRGATNTATYKNSVSQE
jgi:hypothetical protein